jgi:predicted metal-dependent enzyme (double-stranded beta helix superfamily)
VLDLDLLVTDCAATLADGDRMGALRSVLDRVAADPSGVAAAVGEPAAGGLGVIHRSPELTILNVVWSPATHMPPHDHRMSAGLVVYGGQEDNDFYRRRGEGPDGAGAVGAVEAVGGRTLVEGDVLLLGDDAIHGVRSHADRYTGAIHVYLGDFFDRERCVWSIDDGTLIADPPEPGDVIAEAERRWQSRLASQ